MILNFPNFETLRIALATGLVPPDVSTAPAHTSQDDTGRVLVETARKIPKKNLTQLETLKVTVVNRHAADPPDPMANWLQILPLIADGGPVALSSQAPVLFELASPEMLPAIVGEMLRLGNDRQTFRMLEDGTRTRILLRVIGPPYYTLLRAIDRLEANGGTVRAYTEQAPRVWVELGHAHPFAKQIVPAEGQILLLRPPRHWLNLPDGDFQDIYDILNFPLPNAATPWTQSPVRTSLPVPLKLVPGNAADPAEMWVIRRDGLNHLETLVRNADERLIEQLRFAVGVSGDGEPSVILGVMPSRKSPPVLALENALAFKSYWRIPNLFLPAGTRLQPTVRRDVVTRLLAPDRDRRVWLTPGAKGAFVPESIAENAFRPLADWVEYVIDSNASELREWIASTEFAFEEFVCQEGQAKPKRDRDDPNRTGTGEGEETVAPLAKPAAGKPRGRKSATAGLQPFAGEAAVARPPSEWKLRCDELERQFRELEGPLDLPERLELWPQLAIANANMGEDRKTEAAVCWLNGIWEQDVPPSEWIAGWARSETPHLERTAAELDARFAAPAPTPGQVRAAVSLFLATSHQDPRPDWLPARLPAVQKYLEEHEAKLPIRGAWLAALRLAQLTRGDALGLARVRDRLLNRLLDKGLSAEQDLPSFLRFAGSKNSERVRAVRERAVELHRAARRWTEKSLKPGTPSATQQDTTCTLAYLDLLFAFGLARLGDLTPAQALVESARQALTVLKPADTKGIAANFLFKVLKYRVDGALAGKPNVGTLPRDLLDELETMNRKGGAAANDPHKLAHYVVNRMREQSEIVEPHEKNDPYAEWQKHGDDLKKELAELPNLKDANVLGRRLQDLFKNGVKGRVSNETRFTVLHDALHLAPRVGLDFTVELLAQVPVVFRELAGGPANTDERSKKQGKLLERALFLAAHFDKIPLVQALVDAFLAHVHTVPEDKRFELANVVAGRCLTSLRKVGLRDDIDRLLHRLQDEILKGQPLAKMKADYSAKPDVWIEALQTMLNIASGWLTFGLLDQAVPILETARQEILDGSGRGSVQKFTNLCRAYVAALGQGPADFGMPKLAELFDKLDPTRITNTFTTAPYYSRLHLNLIESVVLAVASDEFALGQTGQRWLDEDEYLVRRRIHRDMRDAIAAARV